MTCECSTAVNDIVGSNKVGYEDFFFWFLNGVPQPYIV